jgi:hypothetical protein
LIGEDDIFPIGLSLSFNCKTSVDMGNMGKQQPSPLIFILTDTGLICTFFAINLESKAKSICYDAKTLAYKQPVQAGKLFRLF